MASFRNLRRKPSARAEGSRVFRLRLVVAAVVLIAASTAVAISELATQGTHAVRSTPEFLTETQQALQLAALSVGVSALDGRDGARG